MSFHQKLKPRFFNKYRFLTLQLDTIRFILSLVFVFFQNHFVDIINQKKFCSNYGESLDE